MVKLGHQIRYCNCNESSCPTHTSCSPLPYQSREGHVLCYLSGCQDLGIEFSRHINEDVNAFVNFPVDPTVCFTQCDANWGPQDQSKTTAKDPPQKLFKSRSLSGYIIWLGGPLHWQSKRQTITARSSCEAEIFATDECVKSLQQIQHIFQDLHLHHLLPSSFMIYNDNEACVRWSGRLTTRGLRH